MCGCGGSIAGSSRIRIGVEYTDLALTPVADDETETHELFDSAGAQAYVEQEQRLERLRHGEVA